MKRLEEKVKDIVEVRAFAQLSDFAADPALTLSSYRFTDITSDLMAKWIERVAGINRGVGCSAALAGFRGVGKSHFLAAVSAVLSKPELRAEISEPHVRSAAEGLARRSYHIATVKRGSGPSLLEELRVAAAAAIGAETAAVGSTVSEILHNCSVKAGDNAFVIFFDTMSGRETRVARDDGSLLSEVAEIGKSMGMFVGVALDDDISGADGVNSSISASYLIDYLDQEHLFKIVDTHIFAKDGAKLPLLRDIYQNWRTVLPAFRWSEPRFLSLYPMHPAALEVAPLIRLYIQDFALLGFAAEAGVKILGRPANSLIGLDEMYDSVEAKLRQVAELNDVYAAFDRIEKEVVAKAPVATRLSAKLILKGLLLLSLDGQGVSADDIAAGMMIYSESGPGIDVKGVLDSFVAAGAVSVGDGTFRLGAAAATGEAASSVDLAASEVSDDAVWDLLLRLTSEKFSDLEPSDDFGQLPTVCTVEWRGAIRRGEVVWRSDPERGPTSSDWTIFVERRGGTRVNLHGDRPAMLWRVAALTEQERSTLRRFHVIRSDASVREELGDGLATAMQIHSIAAERIWQRAFLQEATLVSSAGEYPLFDGSIGAHTLTQVLSNALTPFFDRHYPEHPTFEASLGVRETSLLVSNFFGGAAPESPETKRLAEQFALPMGLAIVTDAGPIATPIEQLLDLQIVRAALGETPDKKIALSDIAARLMSPPLGLTREAQHLMLAALVGQRQFDFVTASGNRINHRSLDLQIIWDDIEGIAEPQSEEYSVDRLLSWAKVLTGNGALKSIDRGEDRRQIIDSLRQWLSDWDADNTLAKFDALPEEQLNTTVWKLAAGLKRTFGTTAAAIASLLADETTLVDCLRSIAGLFNDSEPDYELKTEELAVLNKYVLVSSRRGQMLTYVAAADWTGVDEIDSVRRELLGLLIGGGVALNGKNDRIDDLWHRFRDLYAAYYAACHQELSELLSDGHAVREVMSSEMWSAFRGVAELPLIDSSFRPRVEDHIRQMRSGGCTVDAREALSTRPVCVCGQGLRDIENGRQWPASLNKLISDALAQFRERLLMSRDTLIRAAKDTSPGSNVEFILDSFRSSPGFPRLTGDDLSLISRVCSSPAFSGPADFGGLGAGDFEDIELLAVDR